MSQSNRLRSLMVATLLFSANPCVADPPWWLDFPSIWQSFPQDIENWAPINVGQLKHVATRAKAHLDSVLVDYEFYGAGPMVNAMCQFPNTENYAPVNVGQLKYVASVFHARLRRFGYNWQANWQAPGNVGTPMPAQRFPWTGTTNLENTAPANVGQLKNLFDFQITFNFVHDGDWDGMPDGWEVSWFLNAAAKDGAGDADGDGLSDREEFLFGGNPTNADSDGDGFTDLATNAFGFELDQQDLDGDTWDAAKEQLRGTNPLMADTDHDGVIDSVDLLPLDPLVSAISGGGSVAGPPVLTLISPAGAVLIP